MNVHTPRAVYVALALCALTTGASVVFAQSTPHPSSGLTTRSESSHRDENRLIVEVFDYSQVSPRTLEEAEQVASGIFARAGVDLLWTDCVEGGKPQPYAECDAPMGDEQVGVRILPHIPLLKGIRGDGTLGFTVGDLSTVSLERAEEASANVRGSLSDLLGCAIAHELGHVLLGPHSHSAFGLMQGRWDVNALLAAARHGLFFAPEEAATIRVVVLARTLPSAALAGVTPTSGK